MIRSILPGCKTGEGEEGFRHPFPRISGRKTGGTLPFFRISQKKMRFFPEKVSNCIVFFLK